jgi:uncharacterized damage-inducible protein DinB
MADGGDVVTSERKDRQERCPLCTKLHPVLADLRTRMAEAPERLRTLIRGLSATKRLARPAPGKWSIHEIVCHLADVEVANAWRYRKVLAGEDLAPTVWSQDGWAAAHQYRKQDLREALERFRVLRASHVALLTAVGRRAWGKTVSHPVAGRVSAAMIATHLCAHDANHLARIAEIRGGTPGRAG